tara:strand:- start:279 stop:431 length:153 start_codon:yes stop_codon:yes gene_type:complete
MGRKKMLIIAIKDRKGDVSFNLSIRNHCFFRIRNKIQPEDISQNRVGIKK